MRPSCVRTAAALLAGLAWLTGTTSYGAGAAVAQEHSVDLGGEPVDGSASKADPTPLTAGLWADRLGPSTSGEDTHYFSYERQMRESTVHIGVIGASSGVNDAIDLTVLGPDEASCGYASGSAGYSVPHATFGTSVSVPGPDPDGVTDDCSRGASLLITIERTYGGDEGDELPIAVKIVEEAPATNAADLPAAEESPRYRPVRGSGEARPLDGATAFDDAPLLDPVDEGVHLSTEVPQGGERLFRIPVTWGQVLTVTAQAPAEELESTSPYVELDIVDPTRDVYADEVSDYVAGAYYGTDPLELGTATPPVQYRNRYSDVPATVPGDYWVSIAVSPAGEDETPVSVPLDVAIAVTGAAGGAPTYPEDVVSPDGVRVSGYRSDEPFLVGDGEFAAVASGSPAASLDGDGDDGWLNARRGTGLGLAAVSLVLCGLGAWRLAVAVRR